LKPVREHATNNHQAYFVTSQTGEKRLLFRNERWAVLFLDCLYHYRSSAYLLHEFVLMPDHFHLLITPTTSLEKTVQYIKGGFSYRAKKELNTNLEVWQRGFSDHRIRDAFDYQKHVAYIYDNPVRKHLSSTPQDYQYSSAHPGFVLDALPQGLKPGILEANDGTAEAVPLQNKSGAEAVFSQRKNHSS